MSYAGHLQGLGQASSTSTTLPAQSALIVRLQTLLMQGGLLNIHTADGLISSSTSATLVAIRAWATAHGMSSSGVARTSGGGLSIPTPLLNSILGTPSASASSDSGGKGSAATPSAMLPSSDMVSGGTTVGGIPSWIPWVGGGAVLLAVGAVLVSRR